MREWFPEGQTGSKDLPPHMLYDRPGLTLSQT